MERIKPKPLRFKWWKGRDRWDAVNMGEPDFFAYMIRYVAPVWKSTAWCWTLVMPRGSGDTYTGWASAAYEAKRQVEDAVSRHW